MILAWACPFNFGPAVALENVTNGKIILKLLKVSLKLTWNN